MFGNKYSKFLTVLLIIIIIAVIGLLGFIGYNVYTSYSTKKGASEFVEAFVGESEEKKDTNEAVSSSNSVTNNTSTNTSQEENVDLSTLNIAGNSDNSGDTKTVKKNVKYKGFDTVGTIQIPSISVNYPVLAKTTKKSLETSVAVLYPDNAELNQVGNVVIVGHNYRNGTFFSNNKKLKIGDRINITDLYGKKIVYIIYNIFEANQSDTSFYNRDTNGAREITLSTCTDASNDMRLIVEAKEQ